MTQTPAHTMETLEREIAASDVRMGARFVNIDTRVLEWLIADSRSAAATEKRLLDDLTQAETKAWDSLSRYKFQMFGYWSAIWVHLNRVGDFKKASPFGKLVQASRAHIEMALEIAA